MNDSLVFDLVVSSILFIAIMGSLIALIIHYRKLDKQDSQRKPA
jgi:uncharacterized membrane protein